MSKVVISRVGSFLRSAEGATATEYGIMLGIIVLVAAAGISSLGSKASSVFSSVDDSMAQAGGAN